METQGSNLTEKITAENLHLILPTEDMLGSSIIEKVVEESENYCDAYDEWMESFIDNPNLYRLLQAPYEVIKGLEKEGFSLSPASQLSPSVTEPDGYLITENGRSIFIPLYVYKEDIMRLQNFFLKPVYFSPPPVAEVKDGFQLILEAEINRLNESYGGSSQTVDIFKCILDEYKKFTPVSTDEQKGITEDGSIYGLAEKLADEAYGSGVTHLYSERQQLTEVFNKILMAHLIQSLSSHSNNQNTEKI
jgi:hypothetical protein